MNFRALAGANIATQWYCPPDVGAMDANSAMDVKVERVPAQTIRKPYTRPADPPLVKSGTAAYTPSQVMRTVQLKATMDMKPKLR